MAFDAHKNFAYSTVATAPSPATSGTSLVVASGEGARFPAVPFNATVWPLGVIPTPANAEIVRVTAIATDTLTITRAQESSTARTVVVGDQIAATITNKTLTDVEGSWLRETFRGLTLRTHPDSDVAASKVYLDHADEIVLHDGTRVADWDDLSANIAAAGAGGLDTGAEGASRWYEIHAIRKSSDGTKNLLLHRARSFDADQSLTTGDDNAYVVRFATGTRTALAQGFTPAVTGLRPFIDVYLKRTATPTGRVWIELQSNSGGVPSNTVLATSDKIDATVIATSNQWVRFVFRTPISLTASTVYHIVVTGDWTASDANYLEWRADTSASPYTGGTFAYKDGGTWTAVATSDAMFKDYVEQNNLAVTMPTGYDQRCKIGWVYNDSGSNFRPMQAQDRVVFNYNASNLLSGGTATVSTLLDASAFLPPEPTVLSQMELAQSTAGSTLSVSSLLSPLAGAFFYFTGPGANYYEDVSPNLPIDYQHCYYSVSANSASINVQAFRW